MARWLVISAVLVVFHPQSAIGQFRPKSVAELLKELKSPKPADRRTAIIYLGIAGKDKPELVVPALHKALSDSDASVRQYAAYTMSGFAAKAKNSIPAIIKLLEDSNKYVRSNAAKALGRFGPLAAAAVPKLKTALKEKQGYVPISAARAIHRINPMESGVGVPVLIAALQNKTDSFVRMEAAQVLEELGPVAKEAIPALRKALADKSNLVKRYSCRALAGMGSDAKPAVVDLKPLLKDGNKDVREAARKAIEKLDPAAAKKIAAAAGKDDAKKLQGTWTLTKTRSNGRDRTALPNSKLVLKGDSATLYEGKNRPAAFTIKLHTTTTPKGIDLSVTRNGKTNTLPAIYELDGDNLRICLVFGKERPKAFAAGFGSKAEILTLTRGEPGKTAWKEYDTKRGLVVRFPAKPDEKLLGANTLLGRASGLQFKYRHPNLRVTFMAQALGYAGKPTIPAGKTHLEVERKAMVDSLPAGTKIITNKKIKLGKVQGVEIVAQLLDGKVLMKSRLYVSGEKVFAVNIVGARSGVESNEAAKFLDSVKLK